MQEGKLKCMLSQIKCIGPDLITLMISGEEYKLWRLAGRTFLQSPVTSRYSRQRALFPNTLSLCSSLNVRDQVSHPHKRIGSIIVVGLEVLTPVVMWDIQPCRPLKVNWRFGGIGHCWLPTYAGFLLGFFFDPENRAIHSSETSVDFSTGYTSLYLTR
jgi:hypothetical protein